MADATFNDILKQQKITNSLLEQEAVDEGKPNPKKFIKEEALSILLQRKYAKSSLSLAKKGNKIADANEKLKTLLTVETNTVKDLNDRLKVLDKNVNFTLIEMKPITGRKHQLRKQLLIHSIPILGDRKYTMLENLPNKKNNLMLHAHKISFKIDNVKYTFSANIPKDFEYMLKKKYLKRFVKIGKEHVARKEAAKVQAGKDEIRKSDMGYAKGGKADKKWIQKATASIKKRGTKGKCTPITKKGCTGRAKALAKTFKKMAKKRKAA